MFDSSLFSRLKIHFKFWQIVRERYESIVRNSSTPGIIPQSSKIARKFAKVILLIWLWIQIGPITVIGRQHLAGSGRAVYTANHSTYFDALIVYYLLPDNVHYMAANDQFIGFGGVKAIAMASFGAFAVDKQKGKGWQVINPAIDALFSGVSIGMFPEGRVNADGQPSEFKKGAARIALGALKKLDEAQQADQSVLLVPMHLCFGTRDLETAGQPSYIKAGFKWRRGVTVTVREPINLREITDATPESVTTLIRNWTISNACHSVISSPDISQEIIAGQIETSQTGG